MFVRRKPLSHPRALLAVLAFALSGCGPVVVDGWRVSCETIDLGACESIAAVALNNLGRSRPRDAQGVITIQQRQGCPEVPGWADPNQCWEATIPRAPGSKPACMVFASRPELGGYGWVAGD